MKILPRTTCTRARLASWTACTLFGFLLPSCDKNEVATSPPTTEKVADNPLQYVGKKLTLSGEVDTVFSARAFELEGNEVFFDSTLLVLTRSPVSIAGQALQDDDRVAVTGTVRNFMIAELERDLGWDIDSELEVEWRNKPAFVADSISRLYEQARWSEQEADRQGVLVGIAALYVADPKALAGQRIEIDDALVQGRMGQGLWLGETHGDQLFIAPSSAAKLGDIAEGDRIDVRGTIREMPDAKDAISRWNLPPNLTEQIEEEAAYVEAGSVKKSDKPRGTARRENEKPSPANVPAKGK